MISNLAAIRLDDLLTRGMLSAIEQRRVTGTWEARPDDSDPTGWSYTIGCKRCGESYPVSGREISAQLEQFAATGRRRGTWYLTRSR